MTALHVAHILCVMKVKITKNDAEEIGHKLGVLADSPNLQEDYGLTQEQANALRDSVPLQGGEWIIPACGVEAVRGEIADHCEVLADMSADARSDGESGQSLRIAKQAERLRDMFVDSAPWKNTPEMQILMNSAYDKAKFDTP